MLFRSAIFFLLIYIFGATDAYQMLKLPLLVAHYIQHRSENPDITIAAFLHIHYNDKIIIDDDFQQDMQLPFKTIQADPCLSVVTVVPRPIEVSYIVPENPFNKHIILNDDIPSSTDLNTIFQPPRA